MTDVEIIDGLAAAEAISAQWDELAIACSRPTMAPAWVLAWWRCLAGPTPTVRVITVRERGTLIGLVPFDVNQGRRDRCDYRLPAVEIAGDAAPLARPGREWEVAGAAAGLLATLAPESDVLALEGVPLASAWGAALQEQWPSRVPPYLRTYQIMGSPFTRLDHESFDAWMSERSGHFRGHMRRERRRLSKAGATIRVGTAATLAAYAAAFVDLHARRWEGRGASNLAAAGDDLVAMLTVAGRALIDDGRLQLRIVELDGVAISAQLYLTAGERILFVNGGWDEEHAHLRASQLSVLHAIESGIGTPGTRLLSMGAGAHPYKLRFADGNLPLVWQMILPPRRRLPLTVSRVGPALARYRARQLAARAMTPEMIAQVKRLRTGLRTRRVAGPAG